MGISIFPPFTPLTFAPQDQVQSHYEDAFMYNGRLSHMVQMMGYHPSYLAMFLKSDDFLMHGNGPLPLHVRNYVAILVSLICGCCNPFPTALPITLLSPP